MTDLPEMIISDWADAGVVDLGRAPEYDDDEFANSRTVVYDAAVRASRTLADHLEWLASQYPVDVFPSHGTSREAIAGTALRVVLSAQAKYLRGEV